MANDFNAALGVRPGDEPGSLVLDPRPEHEIAPDVVHFAVLTALGEIAAARAVEAPVVPATVTAHLLSRAPSSARVGCCERGNDWRSPRARSPRTASWWPR